ncbi:MAG: TraR/DksA C4-type zinc finger protein [Firmicutes bacterium]|nr:TraR/DksA C4-type zinc finger protein [Bacillota bacterium]
MLPVQKLDQYRRRLAEEKTVLADHLASLRGTTRVSEKNAVAELSSYDNHPADLGTETFERAKDLTLFTRAQDMWRMIEDAEERLAQGSYGECERCGREIGDERLMAVPWASLCLDCQKTAELQHEGPARPAEETILETPFHRTFTDGRDQVGFDGEDAWQQVEAYGTSSSPQDIQGVGTYQSLLDEGYGVEGEERGVVEPVESLPETREPSEDEEGNPEDR